MGEISEEYMGKIKYEYGFIVNKFRKIILKFKVENLESEEWKWFFRHDN